MKLGVIAALWNELAPTIGTLPHASKTIQGLRCVESEPYVFAVSGVGARPAATAALLLADAFTPDVILSVGFCGALTDDLQTADLILGGSSGHPATSELLELARAADPKARVGETVMVPKVLVGVDEKRALAKKSGAVAVDMESGAVAVAARDRGLGFLCVKVVIDTPSEPLASTYSGFWSVLKDLVLHPGTIMQMAYDAKRVKLASERLRDFFVALKEKLPVS